MKLYAKLFGGDGGVRAHPSPPLRGSQSQTKIRGKGKVHLPEDSGRLYGGGDNWLGLTYEQELGV